MSGTLYTWAGNARAQAVQAAAKMSGMDISVADFVPGTAPAGFPSHSAAPVFQTSSGDKLTQLGAIMAHVSGASCAGTIEWISFAENVLTPAAAAWVFPTLGAMPNNKGAIAEGKKQLLAALAFFNTELSTRTFLVGQRPSSADAANVAALSLAFKQVLAECYRKNFPHVVRWFNTCINQPAFSSFGQIDMCEKEAQFDGKVFGEMNKKTDQKPKAEKKKPAPKKEKPAPKQEDAAPPAPAGKKDPWEGLAGKYDFDAWKRCYSNNDTIPVAMDYFWEHLDADNYSIWKGTYKYNGELSMQFMAANLIRGMFQRLDKMRKNSFGSCCVLGTANGGLEISGVWFWKGHEPAFTLSNDWQVDWDTYEWEKLDPVADKKTITEYFAHEGDFDGKEFKEGKVWK